MFGILQSFKHSAEMRESKDEMLTGEIVRLMAQRGHPSISFQATDDWQRVRFKTPNDPLLYSIFVTLDRKTGGSRVQEALLGSKATLNLTAEVKNRLSDPDDLIKMVRTDFANIAKMPILGGIKLNHQLNSVFATTTSIIEIGKYIDKGDDGIVALGELLDTTLGKLKEKLADYKK